MRPPLCDLPLVGVARRELSLSEKPPQTPPILRELFLSLQSLVCVVVSVGSLVSNSATPGTVARQAPLSVGFPRQDYRSGLPFSSLSATLFLVCDSTSVLTAQTVMYCMII